MFTYLIYHGVSLATLNVLYGTLCYPSMHITLQLDKSFSHNFHANDDQTAITAVATQQHFVTCFSVTDDPTTIYGKF